MRLEEFGFVFKSVKHLYRVGEVYICDFEIPHFDFHVRESIKVVKTTESTEAYIPTGSRERLMTVEVHFKNQTGKFHQMIKKFILKIGQTPSMKRIT